MWTHEEVLMRKDDPKRAERLSAAKEVDILKSRSALEIVDHLTRLLRS